jgi:hypothetical protein
MTLVLGQNGVTVQPAVDLDFKQDKKLLLRILRLTSETWEAMNAKEEKRLEKETAFLNPVKVLWDAP